MNKTELQIFKQDGATIHVLHPSSVRPSFTVMSRDRKSMNLSQKAIYLIIQALDAEKRQEQISA